MVVGVVAVGRGGIGGRGGGIGGLGLGGGSKKKRGRGEGSRSYLVVGKIGGEGVVEFMRSGGRGAYEVCSMV